MEIRAKLAEKKQVADLAERKYWELITAYRKAIEDRHNQLVGIFEGLEESHLKSPDFLTMSERDGVVTITFYTKFRNEYDEISCEIPSFVFFDEDGGVAKYIEEKNRKEAVKKEQEKRRKMMEEEDERREFIRLKKKFEPDQDKTE